MRRIRWILILLLAGNTARASGAEEFELEKIIVTNRRTVSPIAEATENVEAAGKEVLERFPARNAAEALRYIPGVDVEPRRGFGRASQLTIQGCDARQVRVMIDGIPLNTQSSGEANLVEFPTRNIERIEVIKGAASSIWGSALGGVVNLVTKDAGTSAVPQGSVTLSAAEFRTRTQGLELSGKAAGTGYYLSADYMQSGGRGSRDDVLEKKTFSKLAWDFEEAGKITTSFGYSQAEVNSGRLPDDTWESQPYKDRYGKIGWEAKYGLGNMRVELKHFRKNIISKFFATVDDDVPYLEIKNKDKLYQLSLNADARLRQDDLFVFGADLDYDEVKSDTYLTKAKSVKMYAPYAQYSLRMEPWLLTFGLRYDYNSEFGAEASPSAGAVYHFKSLPGALVRASISRAFNAPPLLWRFNDNAAFATASNTELGPERAWVYEAGFEQEISPAFRYKFLFYRADVTDAIENARTAQGRIFKKNFKKVRRQGVEFQDTWKLTDEFSVTSGAAFNDIADRTAGVTLRGGGKPRQSFDAGLHYENKRGLSVSLIGYYDRWNQPPERDPKDRKMLCDLKVSKAYKNLKLFFTIYNLADSKYWAYDFAPVPERYLEGGATLIW